MIAKIFFSFRNYTCTNSTEEFIIAGDSWVFLTLPLCSRSLNFQEGLQVIPTRVVSGVTIVATSLCSLVSPTEP